MNEEPNNHDARQLRRMLDCINGARGGSVSLIEAADTLLFLRDALAVADEQWSNDFTSHVATLESAGLAAAEERARMGSSFESVLSVALGELEALIGAHPAHSAL